MTAVGAGCVTDVRPAACDEPRVTLGLELTATSLTGYLIAHYMTLVIRGIVWLPSLVVDPLMSLAPQLDWIPVSAVWYLSVAAIVGGHVAGIVLAHRLGLRDSPRRATRVGLPMVALMIDYTVLSLWIIAQPIVVEPGVTVAVIR